MSVMTVRMDDSTEAALDYLQETTGDTKSVIIRDAVIQAERRARRAAMRAQAQALADDPVDRAEARSVLAFMGGSDAW